jgi:hypothetical protein
MLRSILIAIGALAFLCGAVALYAGVDAAWVGVFWGAIVVLSLVFERVRYKPIERSAPGSGWTKTQERFIDDKTGEAVTVWVDPSSGERKYVRG